MAEAGTLNILGEIQSLVSDNLQVVSYKWLSRNFEVSSNDAKRLLREFVEKYGSGLKVLYTLSGWSKNSAQTYQIRLVPGLKLAEIKQEFEDNCSVQVYSVQASIPKDPAALWSAEFLQAEELFDQASNVTNCLRDNRFCGVSNSFVKRHANGKPVSIVPSQPKNGLEVKVPSKNNGVLQVPSVPPPQQRPVQQPSPKIGLQSSTIGTTDGKGESNAHAPEVHAQAGKPHIDKEKSTTLPAYKKKSQNEKNSPGTGASLANLWGRASAKSKSSCPPTETTNDDPLPAITAEAQICAREAADTVSSDDDGHDINCKRDSNGGSSRKRRVVFDFSDDEDDNENVVSLASPDPPKKQPILDSKCNTENLVLEKKDLNFEREGGKLEIKQEKTAEIDFGLPLKEDAEGASKSKTSGSSFSKRIQSHISEGGADNNKKDKATDAASTSPKRRKVLKTRIDERGREVTEVVWEGEDANSSKTDKNATTNSAENRLPPANKAPALGSTGPSNPVGKAGNKKTAKGGGKDAKQGNILSFFKKA